MLFPHELTVERFVSYAEAGYINSPIVLKPTQCQNTLIEKTKKLHVDFNWSVVRFVYFTAEVVSA
jgi:hypothetical protein